MSPRTGLSRGVLLPALLCAAGCAAVVRLAAGYDDAHSQVAVTLGDAGTRTVTLQPSTPTADEARAAG